MVSQATQREKAHVQPTMTVQGCGSQGEARPTHPAARLQDTRGPTLSTPSRPLGTRVPNQAPESSGLGS